MIHSSALRKINFAVADGRFKTYAQARKLLFAAFVLGLIFGSLVGASSPPDNLVEDVYSYSGGGGAWLFFALLIFFSTSYLGLLFIPLLIFVRGFVFSCCLAVLYSSMGTNGLLFCLVGCAIPLCVLLPCYIIVGDDCLQMSRDLLYLRFRRAGGCFGLFPARHFAAMLLLSVFDVLYSACLAPVLCALII